MLQTDKHLISTENSTLLFKAKNNSPVLISVPHDGFPHNEFSGLFEPRKIGYFGRDLRVWSVAKDILALVSINAIRGLMPRAFVDYNRAWPVGINYYPLTQKEVHTALVDERLVPTYEYYHASIDRILTSSIETFRKEHVLMIDLHGFSKQPPYAPEGGFDLIFGTGNRISIPHGDIDRRFATFMTNLGYKVFLPQDTTVGAIEDYYSADFTTRHHSEKHNVNVIQIEIASRFRMQGAQDIGKKLSADFAMFFGQHI